MFFHQLLVAATIASTLITPSVSPSRPRTARLSRGPAWTDFRSLAMSEDAKASAKELLEGKKRIAVVVLSVQKNDQDSPSDVSVFGTLLREGIRFSDQLLLVDTNTTDRLFANSTTDDAARSVAKEHHIDLLVCCQSRAPQWKIEMVLSKVDQPLDPVTFSSDPAESVISQAMKARTSVMKTLDALPTQNRDAMKRAPNASLAAVKLWCRGTEQLRSVVTMQDAAKRKEVCQAILSNADQAITDSPGFIEAYLLKASCFDELGDDERLKQTLRDAYSKRDPKRDSPLTILELEGDYARFALANIDSAMESYMAILDQNPTDLMANWSLIDTMLSHDPDKQTLSDASAQAALLVASHPDSNVAEAVQLQ